MVSTTIGSTDHPTWRRSFLKASSLLAAGVVTPPLLTRSIHVAGSDVIKIGLIGCGGRGLGAAVNAMNAGRDIRVVAMADLFEDKVQVGQKLLTRTKPEQVDVPADRCFFGFDAYTNLIQSDVDVVLIATTSHFHPRIFEAAVRAGKHVFCEKPHALDAPALKRVAALCEEARQRGRCVVSGLMNRYHPTVRETMKRVSDGAVGRIVTIQETYAASPYRVGKREPEWTELQWQMRNWYHFNWLAGDQCLQQLIHSIDKGAWALGDKPPVKAWGMGGRSACFGDAYGDLFDHQTVVFEYADGVRMYGLCQNHVGCYHDLSDVIFGTKGRASLLQGRIEGEMNWRYEGPRPSPYEVEHQELFEAIRRGTPINNGNYMVSTTMLALLAQYACLTGRELTWEQVVNSKRTVELPRYDWEMQPPIMPNGKSEYDVAIPGITKVT